MDHAALLATLQSIGQGAALRFFDRLDPAGQANLADQLQRLDLDGLSDLIDRNVRGKPPLHLPHDIAPVTPYPRVPGPDRTALYAQAEAHGRRLLAEGKVGAFLVAGGQGTRLGYDGPKGEYPVTPIRNCPLFAVFAEQLLAHSNDVGRAIPWYIMTSEVNDAATRAFFEANDSFGYDPANVFFFVQGMLPAFAFDGSILLSAPGSLALSPDGHGGSLRALWKSGAVADMRRRGVEHLSYFQVDNPLVQCIDPLFLGLHAQTASEMSSKTIPKSDAREKVGNFCLADGTLTVIEYSDLPDALATQTNPDGSLRFNAGSIAIHALSVAFIERLNQGDRLNLPWHRAEKKVPYVDGDGNLIKPDKPNAIKLEQFVFDAIPLARNPLVLTTDRAEEFSPVKNAEGSDSPATCRRDQIRRAARWLEAAGVKVPMTHGEPAAVLEISPLYATSAAEVIGRKPAIDIAAGELVLFDDQGMQKVEEED